jgi:hypothetical protein
MRPGAADTMPHMGDSQGTTAVGRLAGARAYFSLVEAQAGNANALRQYWAYGEGAARIRWGTDGDLTRCHDLVTKEAGVDAATFDVWGFCQNLHILRTGRPNPRD